MKIISALQHKYGLSEQGARDLMKSSLACALMDITLMLPVGLLYLLVGDLLGGGIDHPMAYVVCVAVCVALIVAVSHLKYNKQYTSVYVESGKRRIALAEKLRRLPLSFFGKRNLADLSSTIMADCTAVETGTSHFVPDLMGSMLSTALVGASLFIFDWRMALAAVWVIPVSMAIVMASARVQRRIFSREHQVKLSLADHIQEGLELFQDIRGNSAERGYLGELHRRVEQVEQRALRNELLLAYFVGAAQLVLRLGIASVALVGAALLSSGGISLMVFFMFLLVVSRLYEPMSVALINMVAINAMNIPCERMDAIMSHGEQSGANMLTNSGFDVEFHDVHFAYDADTPVLNGVAFRAKQGEVTAIIGPSGSGKTTITRLAARFWDVSAGRITVGGMDIAQVDPETLLSLYSIVFQDVTLFNNTVLENIRIGRKEATDDEVLAAARLAHVDAFAERLPQGWGTLIGENGSELSGGERQRISIARAFLKDAPIVLLDEATASLDAENETFVQESLSRLVRGKTVLVIAHRMRTVAGADSVVVLAGGRVQQQGSPAELARTEGFYRDMLALQQDALGWSV
ncbi:MAG: ABC transporter ATP-binding protein [Bacteroidales bacterium]|nr:ABC transporter ATP-binding protein [Bacteroidales bacterium]